MPYVSPVSKKTFSININILSQIFKIIQKNTQVGQAAAQKV